MALKLYSGVVKEFKLKVREFPRLIPTFGHIAEEKLEGGGAYAPPSYILNRANPIQDGEGAKKIPLQFSPVTSLNVGISPQNVLTFGSNPFTTLL